MADVSRFGTLLIPNKTGNSQLEYPIEKTSVLIGRCVIDRDWDSSPENSGDVVLLSGALESVAPNALFLTLSLCHFLLPFAAVGTRRVISGSSTRRYLAGISSCRSTRMASCVWCRWDASRCW